MAKIETYIVNLQLHAFEFVVKAKSKSEARKKALARAVAKNLGLIDKHLTSVEKY